MKKRNLTERDIRIFIFLWRWKMASTAYLHLMFFSKNKAFAAYFRLNKLRKGGYLQINYSEGGAVRTWGLTKKSFRLVKSHLPTLAASGYKSESMLHDQRVQAIHVGVFDGVSEKNIETVTEQELRSYSNDVLPKLVNDTSHRPDGYWIIEKKNAIALEVEISEKSSSEYYKIGHYYKLRDGIKCVLWVVNSVTMATRIYHQMHRASQERCVKHACVLHSEFSKNGILSRVESGTFKGKKVIDIFESLGAIRHKTFDKQVLSHALNNSKIRCWN